MKKLYLAVATLLCSLLSPVVMQAQYSSIVNQAANMLQTAVIGGFSYKGFVDASYTGGFGSLKANFVGVSTVQGFQYANWFLWVPVWVWTLCIQRWKTHIVIMNIRLAPMV